MRKTRQDRLIFIVAMTISSFVLVFTSFQLLAGGYGNDIHDTYVTNNVYPTETYYITEETTNTQVITSDNLVSDGIALSLSAAALQFDWGTDKFQWSGGLGHTGSRTSGSFGIAKQLGGVLLNGSYNQALESGVKGYNIGLTGRF